mmetsp:Transcript_13412/g.57164  ORF Transcript_13412/g.57164 Transcript_13412/m.57164 type:complete len:471 (+) Transcript_13412:4517-5929(+)
MSSKGTPRGRGAIRRISRYGLVFNVSEREPAVVPGDGAEEVVPRRRRALRRRAQSFPDVARAGVARGGERRQHLQRRGERLHTVLPLADGVQEHAQRRLVRTRLGRVAPIRTFGEVFRDVAPRRLRALAVRLRERSAQRDERRFAHRILILAHRAQTLTLGKVHVVIIVSDGSVVTVRGDAVRVERVILRAVRAVREIVGARGVALLARDLLRRHRRRHRGERVAQVGVVQSRAHRGTQNFQTEIQVRSPGKLVFVAKSTRRQHAPQRHERAFVRRGDDFLLGRLRVVRGRSRRSRRRRSGEQHGESAGESSELQNLRARAAHLRGGVVRRRAVLRPAEHEPPEAAAERRRAEGVRGGHLRGGVGIVAVARAAELRRGGRRGGREHRAERGGGGGDERLLGERGGARLRRHRLKRREQDGERRGQFVRHARGEVAELVDASDARLRRGEARGLFQTARPPSRAGGPESGV